MSKTKDSFVLANSAHIRCTVRTVKPFELVGKLQPWVTLGEISSALLYLAARAGHPDTEIHALKEQLESLSSSLKNLSASQVHHPAADLLTSEQ